MTFQATVFASHSFRSAPITVTDVAGVSSFPARTSPSHALSQLDFASAVSGKSNQRKGSEMNQVAEVREMEVCLDPTGRRFVAVFEDGSVSAWTGRQASEGCDSKDLHGEEFDLFYNEAGTLYPVTHGKIERQGYSENPDSIYYGSSPMIANGKIVGYVDHTDH